jgi:hypothetical protein
MSGNVGSTVLPARVRGFTGGARGWNTGKGSTGGQARAGEGGRVGEGGLGETGWIYPA